MYLPKDATELECFRHCADLDAAAILPLLESLLSLIVRGLGNDEWSYEDASGEQSFATDAILRDWEGASRQFTLTLRRICYDEPGLLKNLESCQSYLAP